MNYEDRIEAIEYEVARFQRRYSPPRAMTPEAQADSFSATCKSINRKLPSKIAPDALRERMTRIFEHVADRHETNAWPLQAEYIRAVNATAANSNEGRENEWTIDPVKHAAKKIRAGEPVGEGWLFGRNFRELHEQESITDADVKPYRDGLFYAERKIVGEPEAQRRQRERMQR